MLWGLRCQYGSLIKSPAGSGTWEQRPPQGARSGMVAAPPICVELQALLLQASELWSSLLPEAQLSPAASSVVHQEVGCRGPKKEGGSH